MMAADSRACRPPFTPLDGKLDDELPELAPAGTLQPSPASKDKPKSEGGFMKIMQALLIASLLLGSRVSLAGHEGHEEQGAEKTVVGEVIDPVCYLSHDSRGAEHAACARSCAKQGVTLGILEEKTGKLYVSLPVDHSNPNGKLFGHIAQRVEVKGPVFRKGGLTGIFVRDIRELPGSSVGKK